MQKMIIIIFLCFTAKLHLKDKWNGFLLTHGPSAPTEADECVDAEAPSVHSGGTKEKLYVNKKNNKRHPWLVKKVKRG